MGGEISTILYNLDGVDKMSGLTGGTRTNDQRHSGVMTVVNARPTYLRNASHFHSSRNRSLDPLLVGSTFVKSNEMCHCSVEVTHHWFNSTYENNNAGEETIENKPSSAV